MLIKPIDDPFAIEIIERNDLVSNLNVVVYPNADFTHYLRFENTAIHSRENHNITNPNSRKDIVWIVKVSGPGTMGVLYNPRAEHVIAFWKGKFRVWRRLTARDVTVSDTVSSKNSKNVRTIRCGLKIVRNKRTIYILNEITDQVIINAFKNAMAEMLRT